MQEDCTDVLDSVFKYSFEAVCVIKEYTKDVFTLQEDADLTPCQTAANLSK